MSRTEPNAAPPPPLNLSSLSFETFEDARRYFKDNAKLLSQIWLWHGALGNRPETVVLPGVCDICERTTNYTATPRPNARGERYPFQVHWWSSTLCDCGKPAIERAVMRTFLDSCDRKGEVYHVGHFSRFRKWLGQMCENVTASQYEAGRRPGEIVDGVRYEDLNCLSFPDARFDTLICMEVLEHIPDYKRAMTEMARVLKPGGKALLTFPWLGGERYDHLVRAEMQADGTIRHILAPEYHGDPAKSQGILSFRAFGWKVLDELREAGFSAAAARYVFGPLHGHMSISTPVVVATV